MARHPHHSSGRVYAGESAAERLARQRRQFMDAGLELFGTVGYRATSVRLLCKQAGLIDRYFYRSFTNTEALLAEVFTEAFDDIEHRVVQALGAAARGEGGTTPVEAGLDAFFAAVEDPRVARVGWVEVLGVSPRIDALYTRRTHRFADLLTSVAQGLAPGLVLSPEETEVVVLALVGAVSQSVLYWFLSDYRAARQSLVAGNALIVRGVLGTKAPPETKASRLTLVR